MAKEVNVLIHMTQKLHSSKQVLPKGANDPTKDNEKEIKIERLTNIMNYKPHSHINNVLHAFLSHFQNEACNIFFVWGHLCFICPPIKNNNNIVF
jgi:hypothetical protein